MHSRNLHILHKLYFYNIVKNVKLNYHINILWLYNSKKNCPEHYADLKISDWVELDLYFVCVSTELAGHTRLTGQGFRCNFYSSYQTLYTLHCGLLELGTPIPSLNTLWYYSLLNTHASPDYMEHIHFPILLLQILIQRYHLIL